MDWWLEYQQLIEVLDMDLQVAEDRLRADDTQTNRRQLVRTLLTLVEVLFNRFRTITAEMMAAKGSISGRIDFHELYPLMDESAEVQSNGRTRLVPQRIPLLNHIAFAIRVHAKHKRLDPRHFLGQNGWSQLQKAVRVRHRLTHPKAVHELEVTDQDLEVVRDGVEWFRHSLQELYQVILKSDPAKPWE